MDHYVVRQVSGDGLRLVNQLQKQCLPSDKLCDTSVGRWWVVFSGKEPVGFAGWEPSHQWINCAYLCRCGVVAEHRGAGLQKRLIRARCKDALRHGCDWAITDTRKNPASANSLIGCGFKMYLPTSPWSFNDACYWRKRLSA